MVTLRSSGRPDAGGTFQSTCGVSSVGAGVEVVQNNIIAGPNSRSKPPRMATWFRISQRSKQWKPSDGKPRGCTLRQRAQVRVRVINLDLRPGFCDPCAPLASSASHSSFPVLEDAFNQTQHRVRHRLRFARHQTMTHSMFFSSATNLASNEPTFLVVRMTILFGCT